MEATKKSKPLSEILTGVLANELHALDPESFPHWENMSDQRRRVLLGGMHRVVEVMDLFNLTVSVDNQGMVSVVRQSAAPTPPPLVATAAEARTLGFTGNACDTCGSLQLVSNGACEKCTACGSTTGCS